MYVEIILAQHYQGAKERAWKKKRDREREGRTSERARGRKGQVVEARGRHTRRFNSVQYTIKQLNGCDGLETM